MQASPDTHQTTPRLWLAHPPAPPPHPARRGGPRPWCPSRSTRSSCRWPGSSRCWAPPGPQWPRLPGDGPCLSPPGSCALDVAAGAPGHLASAAGEPALAACPCPVRWEVAGRRSRVLGPLTGCRAPFLVLTLTPWAFGVCAPGPGHSCPLPRQGWGRHRRGSPCPHPARSTPRVAGPCPADACSPPPR